MLNGNDCCRGTTTQEGNTNKPQAACAAGERARCLKTTNPHQSLREPTSSVSPTFNSNEAPTLFPNPVPSAPSRPPGACRAHTMPAGRLSEPPEGGEVAEVSLPGAAWVSAQSSDAAATPSARGWRRARPRSGSSLEGAAAPQILPARLPGSCPPAAQAPGPRQLTGTAARPLRRGGSVPAPPGLQPPAPSPAAPATPTQTPARASPPPAASTPWAARSPQDWRRRPPAPGFSAPLRRSPGLRAAADAVPQARRLAFALFSPET